MRSTIIALFACTTAACVGAPPPPPSRDDGSSSGTAGPTSGASTTVPGADTTGMLDGTDHGTIGTTFGTSATDGTGTTAGTTMGVDPTTGSSGPPPECMGPEKCDPHEDCVGGECVAACGGTWAAGDYAYCLTDLGTSDSATLCGQPEACLQSGSPIDTAVCARDCTTRCDCPGPAATGNAVVTCADIAGGPGGDCYLSCENGEMCPDGMICQDGTHCAHPAQPLAVYGNCGAVNAGCDGGECTTATNGVDTWSVCVTLCPGGDGDCDPAPAGATMGEHCAGVIFPPDGAECHVDCTITADCPMGMVCIDTGAMGHSTLCMWPS